jgi:hypothetical protein
MSEPPEKVALRAFSVLYLIIHSKDNGWLLYKRRTHPFKDRVAYMHALPNASESAVETASQWALQKTGLSCLFTPIGSGYFRTYRGDALDGFVHFTALFCDDPHGTLEPNDSSAEYFWDTAPDYTNSSMLPNMPRLHEAVASGGWPFYIDAEVHL